MLEEGGGPSVNGADDELTRDPHVLSHTTEELPAHPVDGETEEFHIQTVHEKNEESSAVPVTIKTEGLMAKPTGVRRMLLSPEVKGEQHPVNMDGKGKLIKYNLPSNVLNEEGVIRNWSVQFTVQR